jgi:hypothetical protein
MFAEWVLDDPDALARADEAGVLLDLAAAGATVRTAVRLAGEAGIDRLQPEGRPRAVLIAGHGSAALAGDALAVLAAAACPITVLRPNNSDDTVSFTTDFTSGLLWSLPGWTGPSDLLVVLSSTGTEPGLTTLIEQAYAHGCTIVVVAPTGSVLAEAALQTRGLPLPYTPAPVPETTRPVPDRDLPHEAPSTFWGLLAPALALAHRIGLVTTPASSLQAAADRLDEIAVRCRPGADTYDNPAKTLAVQLDGFLPLLWSDSPCTATAARRFAGMLAAQAGRPALRGELPEALATQRGLLTGNLAPDPDQDDFFRDRTEETDELRLKVLLLRRSGPEQPEHHPDHPGPPGQQADPLHPIDPPHPAAPGAAGTPTSRLLLARVRLLADDHQVALSELTSGHPDTLEALTELVALTDFTAVYLGLASSGVVDIPAAASPLDD